MDLSHICELLCVKIPCHITGLFIPTISREGNALAETDSELRKDRQKTHEMVLMWGGGMILEWLFF